jgi:hypothetical protein
MTKGVLEDIAGQEVIVVSLQLEGPLALHRLNAVKLTLRPLYGPMPDGFRPLAENEPYQLIRGNPWQRGPFDMILGDHETVLVRPAPEEKLTFGARLEAPPIRFALECHAEDYEPWTVPVTVSVAASRAEPWDHATDVARPPRCRPTW